jgi:hypothetical protein
MACITITVFLAGLMFAFGSEATPCTRNHGVSCSTATDDVSSLLQRKIDSAAADGGSASVSAKNRDDSDNSEAQGDFHATGSMENATSHIVGGTEAKPFEFEHIVRVYNTQGAFKGHCGGSIIDGIWVLTAAHCIWKRDRKHPERYAVSSYIHRSHDHLKHHHHCKDEKIPVAQVILMDWRKGKFCQADFALLKLTREPKCWSERKFSALLDDGSFFAPGSGDTLTSWQPGARTRIQGVVAGWGSNYRGGANSDVLMKADATLYNAAECNYFYNNFGVSGKSPQPPMNLFNAACSSKGIGPECTGRFQMCAGTHSPSAEPHVPTVCAGDSGGPLMVSLPGMRREVLVGIVSWGAPNADCGDGRRPPVFMRVAYIVPWLKYLGINMDVVNVAIMNKATAPQ